MDPDGLLTVWYVLQQVMVVVVVAREADMWSFLFRLRTSLWLQFKPHQIAAGAAYLSAKLLNMDFAPYQNILQEFQATPAILQDVAQQLMELF